MPPEPRMDALVGIVLEGAYRITRLLGEGAMGAVYEAVQLRLNKRVAIKLMARDLAANREALARFHREAQITSHLGHPHLVTVIDFGTAESGEPYLVMEYLSGEDLEHRVRRVGRLSIESAVHITRQVASALAAAHGEGVVHRDLKPANVFLLQAPGEHDFVKVLDFGISKVKAAGTKLTQTSTLIGTPQYMSPEQAAGMIDQIDHRTDQWALGCIVWEMLSGRGPFVADDLATLLYQVINLDPQPLAARVPTLPTRVESVLRRALSKKMTDRYPAIEDFSRAFEAAAMGSGAEVTSPATAVPRVVSTKETVAYGSSPAAHMPPLASPPAEPDQDTGKQPATLSQAAGELAQNTVGRRLKPAFAVAGAGALLLIAALSLLRSGSAHKLKPTAATAAVAVTAPVPPPATAKPGAKTPDNITKHGQFREVEYEPAKEVGLQSQISELVRNKENQAGIESCYERAAKRDGRMRAGRRLDITVSIGASGVVQQVQVHGPSDFLLIDSCIKNAIRHWRFPANVEEYAMSFPLILQGGRETGKVVGSKSGGAEPSEATKKSDASVDALLRGLR